MGWLLTEHVELLDESPSGDRPQCEYCPPGWVGVERAAGGFLGVWCVGMLLGPEATPAWVVFLVRVPRGSNRLGVQDRWIGAGLVGLVFENCIVDASICFLQCS